MPHLHETLSVALNLCEWARTTVSEINTYTYTRSSFLGMLPYADANVIHNIIIIIYVHRSEGLTPNGIFGPWA